MLCNGAVNTTIEEDVFSTCVAYVNCWATDVFSMGPPRSYISIPGGSVSRDEAPDGVNEKQFCNCKQD
jgi:hypothetical protein